MKIVLIGSGNVATVLGRLFFQKGYILTQVVSRDILHAQHLAKELEADFTDFKGHLNLKADIYIIALTDEALLDFCNQYHLPDKIVLHTAGAISIKVLEKVSNTYGVLYPLQSLRKEIQIPQEIPFLIDGSNDSVFEQISTLAETVSKHIHRASDEERIKIHLAAVMANNFGNYLLTQVEQYCMEEHLNFSLLKPLIFETANRINYFSPSEVQTGPAIRKDEKTIQKHLALLEGHQELSVLYKFFTDKIGEHFNKF